MLQIIITFLCSYNYHVSGSSIAFQSLQRMNLDYLTASLVSPVMRLIKRMNSSFTVFFPFSECHELAGICRLSRTLITPAAKARMTKTRAGESFWAPFRLAILSLKRTRVTGAIFRVSTSSGIVVAAAVELIWRSQLYWGGVAACGESETFLKSRL